MALRGLKRTACADHGSEEVHVGHLRADARGHVAKRCHRSGPKSTLPLRDLGKQHPGPVPSPFIDSPANPRIVLYGRFPPPNRLAEHHEFGQGPSGTALAKWGIGKSVAQHSGEGTHLVQQTPPHRDPALAAGKRLGDLRHLLPGWPFRHAGTPSGAGVSVSATISARGNGDGKQSHFHRLHQQPSPRTTPKNSRRH